MNSTKNSLKDFAKKSKKPIPILFENDNYIAFNKPAGLLVIPSPKEKDNTLVNIVNDQYRFTAQDPKLHPCHRLDKETSGVILFAKGKKNQQKMMDDFKSRSVKKLYMTFLHGKVTPSKGQINQPIKSVEKMKYQKNKAAKDSLTRYNVVDYKRGYCVAEVEPVTGRSNQIRIHFSNIGHPLVGERKYAIAKDYKIRFKRAALHAQWIEFTDAQTKEKIQVKAPLAKDMEKFLNNN